VLVAQLEVKVTTIKRRIQIEGNLYFEYEVSPHRAILARISNLTANDVSEAGSQCNPLQEFLSRRSASPLDRMEATTGMHIPFKQVRLKGQINPLKPPLHVETVLIGRALGQQTGYLAGVGFRIRDDGYVEGEFEHGTEKFLSFGDFAKAVKSCLNKISESND
jgi:hypothetical protein